MVVRRVDRRQLRHRSWAASSWHLVRSDVVEELNVGRRSSALGLPSPLSQQLEERIELTPIALDDRGEFLSVRHRHADVIDDDVDDPEALVSLGNAPFDLERRGAKRTTTTTTTHRHVSQP
jgi:hypothetical protein